MSIYKYFLCAASESEALQALQDTLGTTRSKEGCTVVTIGLYYDRTGGTDEEPELSARDGWFFNVYSEEALNWPEYLECRTGETSPATPWSDLS